MMPAATPPLSPTGSAAQTLRGFAILAAVYATVVYLIPRPESVSPEGWRLTGLFLVTIAGSIIEPIPAGALVLLAVTLSALIGGLSITEALAGYSNPTVWLVLMAFFISRALIQTGLARRVALFFVRRFGTSSLGVAYSLAASDMALATMIPSNGARSGGVVLPIVRSIAELYGSRPGETANRLGAYLMSAVYQSVCVTSAMFITGQVSNFMARDMALQAGYEITPAGWIRASVVPGLLSLLVVPWLTLRITRPEVQRTPEARAYAAAELARLGSMKRAEWILAAVFGGVCFLWMTSRQSWGVDVTVTALLGCVTLLLTGVLTWDDICQERSGWAIFIWYGGLLRLAQGLNDAGVTKAFADNVAGMLSGYGWPALFAMTIVIYFYAHYAFASITAHMLAMFPPFLAVLLAKDAPIGLAVFTFACLANLSACLTHYGTTPAPIYFAQNYVSLKQWWLVGAVASVAHLAIWTTAGFAWWKLIGIW
jgi:divalent anion:Na+ symporter, DASS family